MMRITWMKELPTWNAKKPSSQRTRRMMPMVSNMCSPYFDPTLCKPCASFAADLVPVGSARGQRSLLRASREERNHFHRRELPLYYPLLRGDWGQPFIIHLLESRAPFESHEAVSGASGDRRRRSGMS